ncbi:MAG TPA: DUF1444 family protein [Candidatus Limnocylindrales bacterium]
MERTFDGGRDVGADPERDFGDEPAPAWRDAPPDRLTPIDPSAPVSGHVALAPAPASASLAPEHDWNAAQTLIRPLLKPVGTAGIPVGELDEVSLAAPGKQHTQPLLVDGPCGLPVVYAMAAEGFDVLVNGEHLRSWGVSAAELHEVAMRNLAAWSDGAPWTDEVDGARRLVSSDTGDGWDAARVLLPAVRARLAAELHGRILVGLPERHLLLAGSLLPDDPEFAELFRDFIVEQSGGADEPIDRRVFELRDGELVDFAGA